MFGSNDPPIGLRWRSNTFFIVATVAVGLFTDLFLFGLIVPVLPFLLRDRVTVPQDKVQSYVSGLLAAYAGASVIFSIPAGYIADKTSSRQLPFLSGLAALLAATILLGFGSSIAILVVARILQGVSAAVVWTVGLAMVLDTVGPENLGKTIGSIFSFISVGELLAPVLGGVLYRTTGYVGVFGVGAGVLALDFTMRLLVVEKKTAAKFEHKYNAAVNPRDHGSRQEPDQDNEEASEEDALLPRKEEEYYRVPDGQNKVVRTLPILFCMSDPRLLVSFLLLFVQASLVATFDATIPTVAQDLFNFDSLKAGLLFIALDVPYLLLGPAAGWTVDKYGTKPAAVVGFGFLVPTLILLRLPQEHLVGGQSNVILYCAILAFNGVGLAIIGSPSIVEASDVVQRYDKANPEFFGDNGPYAQLYGFNSLIFSAGLTAGPLLAGGLRDRIGYGNMNIIFAALCGITATLSFIYIGGKPRILQKR